MHHFRGFSTFGRGIKHKRALKTRAAGVFSLLAQWFTAPGVLIGLIHPKGVFQPGHVPFLASVRHFCRVLRGVVFVNGLIQNSVNGLIQNSVNGLIQILRILRAVKIGVLVTAAGATSPSGFMAAYCARGADTRSLANG